MKAVLVTMLSAVLLGCMDSTEHDLVTPDVIRIGVLPDESAGRLVEKYSPLVDYLAERTSFDVELVIPRDYESMLDDFAAHRIHLANFGGLTFTEAERKGHAEPLVMRDVDLDFASCYLVAYTDNRQTIGEFEGEDLAFGPRLSTSGHLMPRYFLHTAGIDPDAYFGSTRHSRGHDETARLVRDGEVAVGAANCVIIESMLRDGRLARDDLRILVTTPAYSDYVWAVDENLDLATKIRLRDAFLDLNAADPAHQGILRKLGAHAYLPSSRRDFDEVRRAAHMFDNDNGTRDK